MRNLLSCSSLLLRIQNEHLRDARSTHIAYIRKKISHLFIYFVGLLIFQCPNRVYNAWKGPFPMNLNQFRTHWKIIHDESFFSFNLFLFRPEYVQIELGQHVIDENIKNTCRVFYGHYSSERLLYTFSRVQEPTIDTPQMTLYVKFASNEQSHSRKRYLYHFESFSINKLRCIIEQLTISSTEFMRWPEKSIFIEKIEQIYNQNPTVFNNKVIKTCGILIGYLYRPTNEYVYPGDLYQRFQFNRRHVQGFDASCSYTAYVSHILVGLFICFLLRTVPNLVKDVIYVINLTQSALHPSVMKQMEELNITLENLNRLLLQTTYENNHYGRLFIVRGKYLIMFMIALHENKGEILRQFYENIPFLIPTDTISNVRLDCIELIENNSSRCVYFPSHLYNSRFKPSNWLHERLMLLNNQYRHASEQQQLMRHQKEEQRRLLALLIEEEIEYQGCVYGNDINRILQGITPASPRFIGQFCLADRQTITYDSRDIRCSICLEDLQINQHFAQLNIHFISIVC